jgi:hypothetical protein
MKKCAFLFAVLAFGLAASVLLAADPEIAWREALRTVVTTNGLAVATDTNAVTAASSKTPAYIGQLLLGGAGAGTNGVWVAKGRTTNDWVQVAP